MRAAGVVAADALLAGAAHKESRVEEVRVRAGGGVDDRPAPVDELELLVVPVRALGALVLAVADGDGLLGEGFRRVGGVEEDLNHLPVALVQVVPVVVGVEEPVLQGQLPGPSGLGRDVGVDSRVMALAEAPVPALVVAARIESVPGEVEVVLVEVRDVICRRPDPHQVHRIPRAAQRNCRLVEEQVDVGRPVRLAVAALLELLDNANDRRVALRERGLVGEVGGGDGAAGEREHGRHAQESSAHAAGLERKMFSGRTSTIPLARHRGFIPFG